jgi:hypothetical protein
MMRLLLQIFLLKKRVLWQRLVLMKDIVSMDELEATEASFDDVPVTSASNPRSVERASNEHTTVGAVTSAMRAAEAEPIAITSSGWDCSR